MQFLSSTLLFATVAMPAVSGQTRAANANGQATVLRYDVSTVRVNNSDNHNSQMRTNKGVYTVQNGPLKWVLSSAFDTRQDLIFGLPEWTDKVHYDITAKDVDADPEAMDKLTADETRSMEQDLFAQRFALKWHYETRTLPAYELVVDKGGFKLKAVPNDPAQAGMWTTGDTSIEAPELPMSVLATLLADEVHRPVVDHTELSGLYKIDLHFSRVQDDPSQNGGQPDENATTDIYTALREQLGLRLQSGREPVRVVVIDHIEPPTPN